MRRLLQLILLLLLSSKAVFGGNTSSSKADFIDSLLKEGQWNAAAQEIHLLKRSLQQNDKSTKVVALRLGLQQAMIFIQAEEDRRALEILLEVAGDAERMKLYTVLYLSHIYLSLVYEKYNVMDLCRKHLDYAQKIFKENKQWAFYSTFCVRSASYYRLIKNKDSASYFAREAMKFATLYHHKKDLADAYFLAAVTDRENAIDHYVNAVSAYLEIQNFWTAAYMCLNLAETHRAKGNFSDAFLYVDSAISVATRSDADSMLVSKEKFESNQDVIRVYVYETKYKIYKALGNVDSLILYMQRYYELDRKLLVQRDEAQIRRITEQFKSTQKETTIKSKNQQLVFAVILLSVVTMTTILVVRKNKKIKDQNKVIRGQMEELQKALSQKGVLLSELQHRVKNNLQHVLSILEMQKESVNFNNVDELIRENKNRVQSMALLHSKLNTSESLQHVNPEQYLSELASLVMNSYEGKEKEIAISLRCNIASMNIRQAFSLGLIIVELISNSMKYAFAKQAEGQISIALLGEEHSGKNTLYYADNGIGFDFFASSPKGLGLEIIKGLINQLNGRVEVKNKNGFKLKMYFENNLTHNGRNDK